MDTRLRKITDYLLLKSSYLRDIGLFHGKMGIAVALYAYANRYQDSLMEEFAWDLFQQVSDGVHVDMPVGLECGLAGIGYGTTLLCGQGCVECDLNAILADIDAKIMERDPRRITDFSVRSGAGGILLYIALRQRTNGSLLTFDSQYLTELQSASANKFTLDLGTNIINILNEPPFADSEYIEQPIGIDGGSAYYILKNILA
mgnify:CR=1 FL=1